VKLVGPVLLQRVKRKAWQPADEGSGRSTVDFPVSLFVENQSGVPRPVEC